MSHASAYMSLCRHNPPIVYPSVSPFTLLHTQLKKKFVESSLIRFKSHSFLVSLLQKILDDLSYEVTIFEEEMFKKIGLLSNSGLAFDTKFQAFVSCLMYCGKFFSF
ncbi:unnamed protein product [Arabidopsis thaliana]|uniref:Uncharacterized protein n=1 Tax=Arabidopsis thaliana TaxID=3702 RepID=Q9LUA8_ARATH|nr:unnamed protein product [Arabidopsis thaliana]